MNSLITRGLGVSQNLITRGLAGIAALVRRVRHGAGGLLKQLKKKPRDTVLIDTNLIVVKRTRPLRIQALLIEVKLSVDLLKIKRNKVKVGISYGTI